MDLVHRLRLLPTPFCCQKPSVIKILQKILDQSENLCLLDRRVCVGVQRGQFIFLHQRQHLPFGVLLEGKVTVDVLGKVHLIRQKQLLDTVSRYLTAIKDRRQCGIAQRDLRHAFIKADGYAGKLISAHRFKGIRAGFAVK